MASSFSAPSAPVVPVCDLTCQFGDVTAVDRVSFDIAAGEAFALIGPNGADKSTPMRKLTTLFPPTSGRGSVSGFAIGRSPHAVPAGIGHVPQQFFRPTMILRACKTCSCRRASI